MTSRYHDQPEVPNMCGHKRKAGSLDDKSVPEPTKAQSETRALYERLQQEENSKFEEEANHRLEWAENALATRPNPEDWRDVVFSSYFDLYYKTQGIDWKYSTSEGHNSPDKTEQTQLRCWSAFGYNFKSPLVWYEAPAKCSTDEAQQLYVDKIWEPHVKKLLEEGHYFALEEALDGGNKPLQSWVEQHGPDKFILCPDVIGESPVSEAWRIPEQYINDYLYWDVGTLKGLAEESWKNVSQEDLNSWAESIPKRLQHIEKTRGKVPERLRE